jgi:CubicO group peptidase (beta-lactamase class C family)
MHIASVSKLLTAIGLFKLLNSKSQVSLDSNIIDFLPAYWVKGANVDKIKFKHLLRHKSGIGFLLPGQSSKSNFAFMKANIARGVIEPGSKKSYQNANFGLMRILMAVVNGDIDTDYDPGSNRDTMWDVHTIAYYRDYMQDHIFTPAGVANAGFAALPGGALAYAFPPGQGWNSGDLQSVAGGAAWRLSVGELLNVMDHFRRRSTILTPDLAQKVLDRGYGNDHLTTLAGKVFYKKGSWGNNGRHEKAIAYFLPEDIEMVIFVNSQVFAQGFALGNIVEDLYKNALE